MRLIRYHYEKGIFWIRILNMGIGIKDITTCPLTFSQRNGYTKGFSIGKYYFWILRKWEG